ncbi:hypothetical protein IFM89_012650 [Coptis chinensis]|uniref:MEKHLA domain-containing protein n=1 Tax=Coptis chinensis TaxID=261450 RepID=A0A835LVJ1_9MAGN|nr:hypothetical protein IFM89_012650 [Coptis chinensis]
MYFSRDAKDNLIQSDGELHSLACYCFAKKIPIIKINLVVCVSSLITSSYASFASSSSCGGGVRVLARVLHLHKQLLNPLKKTSSLVKVAMYTENDLALHISKPETTRVQIQERAVRVCQLCSGMGIGATPMNTIVNDMRTACKQAKGERGFKENFMAKTKVFLRAGQMVELDTRRAEDDSAAARTLDLASSLESGHSGRRLAAETTLNNYSLRLVLTITFQFTFENHYQDSMVVMARQYVRSIMGYVQRVVNAISPSRLSSQPKSLPWSPRGHPRLARWICRIYRFLTSIKLLQVDLSAGDALLKQLWRHYDAIMCCSLQTNASPVFTFANQAGLDMLETTLVALQDIMLDKIVNEAGRKTLCSEFSKIMQQGFCRLPAGICVSSMDRSVSYQQAIAWKVLNEDDNNYYLAFMFMNWAFI